MKNINNTSKIIKALTLFFIMFNNLTFAQTGSSDKIHPHNYSKDNAFIQGTLYPCKGKTSVYTVSPIEGAVSYIWEVVPVSNGVGNESNQGYQSTVLSGQGTSSVSILFGHGIGTSIISVSPVYASGQQGTKQSESVFRSVCNEGEQPCSISLSLSTPTFGGGYNISCYGGANGSILSSVTGGTAPFTYTWSTGSNTATINGLTVGMYELTVTDSKGCKAVSSIELNQPEILVSSVSAKVNSFGFNISCFGGNDGEATANANGGTLPYTFQWSNGTLVERANNLFVGTYSVTVTDANGCAAHSEVNLNQPTKLSVDAGQDQKVYYGYKPMSCANINAAGSGGNIPYIFNWSNGSITSSTTVCPNISTTYSVTLKDASGCLANDEVVITAVDVRCGNNLNKVSVCHLPHGNIGNPQNICIAEAAVATHLAHGDYLGSCNIEKSNKNSRIDSEDDNSTTDQISFTAFPNPFKSEVNINLATFESEKVTITAYNSLGQIIETLFNGTVEGEQSVTRTINSKDKLIIIEMKTESGLVKRSILSKE